MEGRDIGTVVFPQADVKIFLDADPGERARRALARRRAKGRAITDERAGAARCASATSAIARAPSRPLAQAPDAVYLDSTGTRHRRSGRGDPQDHSANAFPTERNYRLNDLLVMKFGGTSVGSAERMRVAARIAADEQQKRPVVVVVSAMSKITDLLLDTMRHAEAGDRAGLEANLASCASGTKTPAATCCRTASRRAVRCRHRTI